MTEPADWRVTSWEGNRRRQHRAYLALSFREKLEILEQMAEMTRLTRAPGTDPGKRGLPGQ